MRHSGDSRECPQTTKGEKIKRPKGCALRTLLIFGHAAAKRSLEKVLGVTATRCPVRCKHHRNVPLAKGELSTVRGRLQLAWRSGGIWRVTGLFQSGSHRSISPILYWLASCLLI
jgi:hypothetical protein